MSHIPDSVRKPGSRTTIRYSEVSTQLSTIQATAAPSAQRAPGMSRSRDARTERPPRHGEHEGRERKCGPGPELAKAHGDAGGEGERER